MRLCSSSPQEPARQLICWGRRPFSYIEVCGVEPAHGRTIAPAYRTAGCCVMDVASPRISLPSEWSVQRGGRYILLRITWMRRSSWPMPMTS